MATPFPRLRSPTFVLARLASTNVAYLERYAKLGLDSVKEIIVTFKMSQIFDIAAIEIYKNQEKILLTPLALNLELNCVKRLGRLIVK